MTSGRGPTAADAATLSGTPAAVPPISSVADLQGLWRRSLIAWPGRPGDTTTSVRWLQGPGAYVDLRQPTPLPDFSHVRSREDLTLEDCEWLARQEGFAGHLGFDGRHFEWLRQIDFQPPSPTADAGSLHWDGDVLIETGRDADYVEHWHREASVARTPTSLTDFQHPRSVVLRVGANFMYARDRATPLDKGLRTLTEYVKAAPDLHHARDLIDCEISFGTVEESIRRITASTLPYRIGALLEPERWYPSKHSFR